MTSLQEAIDEFFLARMPRKHSKHTLDAYRRDLASVSDQLTELTGKSMEQLAVTDLDIRTLRRAFAGISHQSAATISPHLVHVEPTVHVPGSRTNHSWESNGGC